MHLRYTWAGGQAAAAATGAGLRRSAASSEIHGAPPLARIKVLFNADPLNPSPSPHGEDRFPGPLALIWKQLRSDCLATIHTALDQFRDLAAIDASIADLLLEQVAVDTASGRLILGSLFQPAKSESNAYLLYGLLGLLSRSPTGSRGAKLRLGVRRLKATCPVLPEIKGFDSLQELNLSLHYHQVDSNKPLESTIANCFGAFPSLEILRLSCNSQLSISSLDGLQAPLLTALEVPRIGLLNIQALSANNRLRNVVLRGNDQLSDISALLASAVSLRKVEVSDMAIRDFSLIAKATGLEQLNSSGFTGAGRRLDAKHLVIIGRHQSLQELDALETLPIPSKHQSDKSRIWKLPSLSSLYGLNEVASETTSLELLWMHELIDTRALSDIPTLESLTVLNCPRLISVESLSELPSLKEVQIKDCRELSRLPSSWPTSLNKLILESCAITSLGTLPPGFTGHLNLHGCKSLRTLQGVENCSGLKEIIIHTSLSNLDAARELPDTFFHIDLCGAKQILPEALVDSLATLPHCRLRISDSSTKFPKIQNLQILSKIRHLRALDLSKCEVDNLMPVICLDELEQLKIRPRSELSKKLGGCTFDSNSKMQQLQLLHLGIG